MAVQSVKELTSLNHEIGKMLGAMIMSPEKFLLTPDSWDKERKR